MKNFFNIKERKKESVCPVCGGALVDEFCANCNKYTSDETAHKRLKEKHPHVRCKCKSKKIEFSIEESKDPIPKNFLDKAALSLIEKYNQKYPQNIPTYREVLLGGESDFENWVKNASDEELEEGYEERRKEWAKNGFGGNGEKTPEMKRIDREISDRMAIKWENDPRRNRDPNYRWTDANRWDKD